MHGVRPLGHPNYHGVPESNFAAALSLRTAHQELTGGQAQPGQEFNDMQGH